VGPASRKLSSIAETFVDFARTQAQRRLLISIPIVIWGSQVVLKLVERYPAVVYIGAGVLAWTAVKMIAGEPLLQEHVAQNPALVPFSYSAVIGGVLAGGFFAKRRKLRARIAAHLVEDAAPARRVAPAQVTGAKPVRILVPVDGTSNSLQALRHVIDRDVAAHDVQLHLLHVRQPFSELVARFSSRRNRESYHWEAAQRALAPARELLRRRRIPHMDHVELGNKAETIQRMAEELGAAKIVMGTARKNSLTRLMEDSVTHRVLEITNLPVEVVVGPAVSKFEFAGISAALAALLALFVVVID
jgi:nucleotide-binding universal stress UspA family protein